MQNFSYMSRVNKQFIKAGLYYLIDKDKESFLDRMSIYLQDKSEFMNFLFEGPLPINEEIVKKIEEHIKATLPCPDYFDSIVSIEIDFDYNFEQLYKVIYKSTRFYNQDKQPWGGLSTADDNHQISVITECTKNVTPNSINVI